MQQSEFNKQSIIKQLSPYLANPILIKQMAANARRQAIVDATQRVAAHCEQVSHKRA